MCSSQIFFLILFMLIIIVCNLELHSGMYDNSIFVRFTFFSLFFPSALSSFYSPKSLKWVSNFFGRFFKQVTCSWRKEESFNCFVPQSQKAYDTWYISKLSQEIFLYLFTSSGFRPSLVYQIEEMKETWWFFN